ncbi:MAG: YceD family protein [Oceanobacter sp.]
MAEAPLPHRVDAVKLIEVNQRFNAKIDPSKLDRLSEAVEQVLEPVLCELEFRRDDDNSRALEGQCSTRVSMICQRCLDVVEFPIESQVSLGLVFNDDQAKALPRRFEPVLMDENGILDLWSVIEDEVLLALPSFPTHPQSECQLSQPEPDETTDTVERPNPFDVLAQLKKK